MTTSKKQTSRIEAETRGLPLCFILARKGSKRLKRKAMADLNGKPLVHYPIQAAKDSGIFGGIVVSSDDMRVLEYAYEQNVLVHQRFATLAGDNVMMRDVVRYLLSVYQTGDTFCMLTPCNPFVTGEDLKAAYNLIWDKEANYVVSVLGTDKPDKWSMQKTPDGWLTSYETGQAYKLDAGLVISKTDAFTREGYEKDFRGVGCYSYFMPHNSVDINTQEDMERARRLM